MRYTEDSFSFYDRSAWPAIENVRCLINRWAEAYPETEQKDLLTRLQTDFDSTFFELFTFSFFAGLGFELSSHPKLAHTSKKCDFEVRGTGQLFYLECISTSGLSDAEKARKNTENYFYDFFNELDLPGFYIRIAELEFKDASYPAFKKIRNYLSTQINAIDPDSIEFPAIREFSDLPAIVHDDPKFLLKIELLPKDKIARGKSGRAIGVFTTKFHVGGFGHVISDAIKRKATRYGELAHPYMVAIDVKTELPIDEYDIEDALFGEIGQHRIPLILKGEAEIPLTVEASFFALGYPIHTRVSAIMVTNVNPTNLAHAKYWIYYHPLAARELELDKQNLNGYRISKDGIVVIKGREIKDILSIPDDWPGEKNRPPR